jgi:hypothetical protein
MKKHIDKSEELRHSVEDFFTTMENLLQHNKLTETDQDWLEKELKKMEKKLKAYKQARSEKSVAV